MKIFISWSGDLSHKIALLLKDWIQDVIQKIEPYVSTEDIDKGARWFADISVQLEDTDFGIICLTSENLNAPWILFEAGALSKSIDRSKVCPFLIELTPSDIVGPLAQFQACTPTKDDMFRLLRTMNQALGERALEEAKLLKAFERCWSEFEENFTSAKETITSKPKKVRSNEEMLEEILQLSRSISQTVQTPPEYRSTFSDQYLLKQKVGQLTLDEIASRVSEEGGQVLSGSVGKNIMKLSVIEGFITDKAKEDLKEFAGLRGFDLRIKEIAIPEVYEEKD